jgi:hypothetical protein
MGEITKSSRHRGLRTLCTHDENGRLRPVWERLEELEADRFLGNSVTASQQVLRVGGKWPEPRRALVSPHGVDLGSALLVPVDEQ